jgi:hypothetical protein
MQPWIQRPQGWQCPNCGKVHAPSVLTCPAQMKTTNKLVVGSPIPAPSSDPSCPAHGGWPQNICFCEGLTMPHTHS